MPRHSRTIVLAALGLAVATTAAAGWKPLRHLGVVPQPTTAPEIDPASAASALTLLSGALLVLRGRRSKK